MPAPAPAAPPAAPASPAPVAAPAPSAPAPSPAAAPAAPGPASHTQLPTNPQLTQAFSDLENLMAEPKPASSDTPKPDEEDEVIDPDAVAKPSESPKPPEQPARPQPKVATLRKAYEDAKTRLTQLEIELNAIKNAKPPEDPEKKSLAERLAEREKRLNDLEERLRFDAFEKSDEYRDKYEQPFVTAYQSGRAKAQSLKVGTEDGNTRQGKPEDFDAIMQMADEDQAAQLATELFGNRAPSILYWRERVLELNGMRTKAIEDFRKQGSERQKHEMETRTQQQTRMAQLYDQLNKGAIEKFPKLFKPTDGDAKGNELLENGFRRVDMAFNGGKGKDKDGHDIQLKPEELVALHSEVRMKAAAFNRQVYMTRQLEAKVAALEKELAQFKGSEPGAGEGGKLKDNEPKYGSLMEAAEAKLESMVS